MRISLLISALLAAACTPTETSEVQAGWHNEFTAPPVEREKRVSVVGHVLNRATAEPVVGARIEGPGGRTAVSNSAGYFEITGFSKGEAGRLQAVWGKERRVETQLQPLQPGRLEVVLYLGK